MDGLIHTLHQGGFSCVIRNDGKTRTFQQRGVKDLWDLCHNDEEFLKGAQIADKVVGKGAAALMVYGGVRQVHADIISRPALELLQANGIPASFLIQTDRILNRKGDGLCPVESLCLPLDNVEDMHEQIGKFINNNL